MHRLYSKAPLKSVFNIILRVNEGLASENSIDRHIIRGVNASLRNETTRRPSGTRLNLICEKDSEPQFFNFSRVQAARDHLEAKETEKLQKQQELEGGKTLAVVVEEQKERENAERMKKSTEKRYRSRRKRWLKVRFRRNQKTITSRPDEGAFSINNNIQSRGLFKPCKRKNGGYRIRVF